MSTKGQSSEQNPIVRCIRPVAISSAIGIAVCAAFLLLMSVILSTGNVPHSIIDPMALFSMSVGAFVAGLCCGKLLRTGGLLFGAVCGGVLVFVVLTAGLSIGDMGLGIPALFRAVFILLSSMLGGVLGVNAKKRKR